MVSSLALPSFLFAEKSAHSRPEVIYDSYHDTSLPARKYSMATPQGRIPREVERPEPGRIFSGAAVPVKDLAEQTFVAPPVSATIGLDFEGIPNSANGKALEGVPSDNNLAVGATQVVETINTAWQVYDKATGKSVFGPQQISALFTGLPGLCGQGQTFFWTDPVLLYDHFANRWIISQIAADNTFSTGNECIAVSESSDATGKYHRYVFKFGNKVFNDYTEACGSQPCIPQPGTTQPLSSLSGVLMFRLAYRNFTDHESLGVNHAVTTSKAVSGLRWYEIRDPNGTPKVFQQGTFTHGGNSLWSGSIAMDKEGDMALGFSESNANTLHPSLAFTGRVPTDPPNTMESQASIFIAKGSATDSSRWGDYSSMVIDPSDDCTFWYVNQYIPKTFPKNSLTFHTRVASLKFPTCQ
jgi:hypothetical protein